MTDKLRDDLAKYLGELMYERDLEHDWIKKDSIIKKINAIDVLLGIDSKEKTWYEKLKTQLK